MSASNDKDYAELKFFARYLQGTKNMKLTYRKQKQLTLYVYFDASFADCNKARSTGGWIIFLGDPTGASPPTAAIMSESFKEKLVAHSTFESEWYAVDNLCKALEWVIGFLEELGQKQTTVVVHGDNEQVLTVGNECKLHARTKHWKLRMYYVQQLVQDKIIALKYISSANNPSDLQTKGLPFAAHDRHTRTIMGMYPHDKGLQLGKKYSSNVEGDGPTTTILIWKAKTERRNAALPTPRSPPNLPLMPLERS